MKIKHWGGRKGNRLKKEVDGGSRVEVGRQAPREMSHRDTERERERER